MAIVIRLRWPGQSKTYLSPQALEDAMRQTLLFASVACALGTFAAPAIAQRAPVQGRQAPSSIPLPRLPRLSDPSAPNNVYRADALQRRLFAEEETRIAIAHATPQQIKLAGQMQTLIDGGRCGPAAQLAFAEHENALAAQVPRACAEVRSVTGG
jgi:hypothetical protein